MNGVYLSSSGNIVQLSSTPDADPNFGPGAVIHTSADTVKGFPAINAIHGLDQQHTMLYNLDTGRTYVINTDLTNGHYQGGWLYVINSSGTPVFLTPASEISSATVDPYGNLDIVSYGLDTQINASLLYDVQPGDPTSLSSLADQLNLDPSILSLVNPDLDSENLSSGTYVQTYGQGSPLPDLIASGFGLTFTGPNTLIDLSTNTAYAVGSAPEGGDTGTLYISQNGQLLTSYTASYGFYEAYTVEGDVYIVGNTIPGSFPPNPYVLEFSSDTGGWTAFLDGDTNVLGGSYTLSAGSVVPDGISLNDGATVNVETAVTTSTTFDFASAGTKLVIADSSTFGSSTADGFSGPLLEQFSSGDAIDLSGLPYVEGKMSYSYEQDTGLLQISNGTQTATLFFGPGNTVVDDPFHLNPDGSGGTVLTNDAALCYCRGTSIRTLSGDVAIEHLAIGDLVLTQFGGFQPIKWIGRQSYARRFVQNDPGKLPIRITAGALANGLPVHDLYVSPGHSMLLGDRLVLAKSLVNGVTITQDDCPEELHYYQLEFENHDCILAEGAWSESYADGPGLRNQFHNVAEFWQRYPGYREPTELRLCAPRPERGAALERTLRPIVARASEGMALGPLRGAIDLVTADRIIEGWAQDTRNLDLAVMLKVLLDDRVIHTGLACDYRDDLAKAGYGRGHCSFCFALQEDVSAADLRRLRVVRAADGSELFESDYCRAMVSAAA